MVKGVVAFACGITFALGLGIGGLTQPARVLAFLDVAGDWDPRLALVMLGAIAVYAPAYRLALRRGRPLLAPAFDLPTRRNIDGPLVVGAVLFGIGWGLAGLCPGPALTSLGSGEPAAILFVAAMLVGIAVPKRRNARVTRVAVRDDRTIVAAEIRKGEQKLLLPHDDGTPYWSGGRRGIPP
jgi:uncharacterized membrane protein YedE/YeeE